MQQPLRNSQHDELAPVAADVILTVFFEGTANPLQHKVTQVGLFEELTDGECRFYGLTVLENTRADRLHISQLWTSPSGWIACL